MTESQLIQLAKQIRSFFPQEMKSVELHEPAFQGNELKYVSECIETGWVSSVGKYVDLFEKKLAEYTETKYAIAVVNGTAALHMCLILAGIEANDEVLTPNLTFVATTNAISYCKAIPHFIDHSEATLGICPDKLELYLKDILVKNSSGKWINKHTGRKVTGLICMHTYGEACDLDKIAEVLKPYQIPLIEDAAESLGSYYKGKHTGNAGLVSAMSFNGNKVVTTGGGGAILTNHEPIAKLAKHLTTTAKQPHAWNFYHDHVGYNYRMPNINAALGCAQLESLPMQLEKKKKLNELYKSAFKNLEIAKMFQPPSFSKSNYWLQVLLLNSSSFEQREFFLTELHKQGIKARPAWQLMNTLPMFKNCPQMPLNTSAKLVNEIINLPSSPYLADRFIKF